MKPDTKLRRKFFGFLIALLILTFFIPNVMSGALKDSITKTTSTILCEFYSAFMSIATGIALLVFIIAGIKWTGSENDPGARKSAKDAMIHALIGLIIVIIAYYVVKQAGLSMLCLST